MLRKSRAPQNPRLDRGTRLQVRPPDECAKPENHLIRFRRTCSSGSSTPSTGDKPTVLPGLVGDAEEDRVVGAVKLDEPAEGVGKDDVEVVQVEGAARELP